jgi:hypothetical protein
VAQIELMQRQSRDQIQAQLYTGATQAYQESKRRASPSVAAGLVTRAATKASQGSAGRTMPVSMTPSGSSTTRQPLNHGTAASVRSASAAVVGGRSGTGDVNATGSSPVEKVPVTSLKGHDEQQIR